MPNQNNDISEELAARNAEHMQASRRVDTTIGVASDFGLSGRTVLVHKAGEEGALEIDAMSGLVLPGQLDRPEWSFSLAAAQLVERHLFYTNRLGADYADAHQHPEVFAYEDLAWVTVSEAGDAGEQEADAEYRQTVLATVVGMDLETGEVSNPLAEAEIAGDQWRTAAEIGELDAAQREGFKNTASEG